MTNFIRLNLQKQIHDVNEKKQLDRLAGRRRVDKFLRKNQGKKHPRNLSRKVKNGQYQYQEGRSIARLNE